KSLKDFLSFPVKIIIKFYRSVLGKGIRSVCPMYPSCSTYGKEALQSFGPIIGSLKIVDRLNRCGHDTYIYPVIRIGDKLKYLDPVVWELP
ncbi:MAG: membrane protein insertion efficiency factor YidD, partial [Candidatus Omnitrophica bacterium]|nr:membrane protein insertion efficiency factor YidD [Candidatus Omnitrophota bacterium]